jgi:hypothetical protein
MSLFQAPLLTEFPHSLANLDQEVIGHVRMMKHASGKGYGSKTYAE